MAIDNALYFPYVNVPYDSWLGRILLYWDKVGSIVPGEYLHDPGRLDPAMRELVAAGLVEQVVPRAYAGEIENLSEPFLRYVRRRIEAFRRQQPARVSAYRSSRTLLHLEKMGSISDELVGLGVARLERYPWFEVEAWAADAFMFLLTSKLGKLEEVNALPVTNERVARTVPWLINGGRKSFERRVATARGRMLKAVLPAPTCAPNVLELLRFKERHGHLLAGFRRRIETASVELAGIKDPIHKAYRTSQLQDEIDDEVDEISRAMSRRWGDLTFRKLLPIVPPTIGVASLAAGQPQIGAAATTGASLVCAVVSALYRPPNLKAKQDPLAYVAHARHTFGWHAGQTKA